MQVLSSRHGVAVLLVTHLPGVTALWLAERTDHKPALAGLLECPGGGLEDGETPVEAARREVLEESGIELSEDRLEARGVLLYNGKRVWIFTANLRAEEWPKNTEPDKRGPWRSVTHSEVQVSSTMPSVAALVAILQAEARG